MSATSATSARLRRAARTWWSQRARPWLARFDGPGLAVGLLFFTQAMGPALTPRSAVLQGASGGVCAVIGYGLTTGALALGRAVLGPRVQVPAAWRRWGWRVLAVVTVPAQRLAVIVHAGPYEELDLSYGVLGRHVLAQDAGADGPIRETYLVSPGDTDDPAEYRVRIGWPITPEEH